MESAASKLTEWEIKTYRDEILAFLYESGTLIYDDICFHLRSRINEPFTRGYAKHMSEEQLQKYRAETMEKSKGVANHLLDELLREGAIKGNCGGYSITEVGKHYLEFWNEHEDDWCRLMDESGEDIERYDEDSYIDDRYDGHWEENEKDHKFMERLFDIES